MKTFTSTTRAAARLAQNLLGSGNQIAAFVRDLASRLCTPSRYQDWRTLDERTLRDLGLSRSELASLVDEAEGRAPATRRRIV